MENQITPITFTAKNTTSTFSDFKAGHVCIRTTKYSEIIQWYQENLDFRIIHEWMFGDIQLAFIAPPNDDDFIIEIICYNTNEEVDNDQIKSGYDHLSFHVQNLDKTIEELTKRNIPIERSFDVPMIGLRVAFISDTFGNSIEFCEKIV